MTSRPAPAEAAPARRRSGLRLLGLLLALAAVFAVGWWAARATLTDPAAAAEDAAPAEQWATAVEGRVGRSLGLQTAVNQPVTVAAANHLPGVVTATSPGTLDNGGVLYRVGATPVRLVVAPAPFWRDLAPGVAGEDVRALQDALASLGHLDGDPSGTFDDATEDAVRAWEEDLGAPVDGVVTLGEVAAVPSAPVAASLAESVAPGRVLAGGEEAVRVPSGERSFDLVLSQDQARLVPPDAAVEVRFEDVTWPAEVAEQRQTETGLVYVLAAPDGGPVCGQDCGRLPAAEQTLLSSTVTVVPEVEGVTVPAGAVITRADGTTAVRTEAGEVPVRVLAAEQGVAVVEGLEAGTRVRLGGGAGAP